MITLKKLPTAQAAGMCFRSQSIFDTEPAPVIEIKIGRKKMLCLKVPHTPRPRLYYPCPGCVLSAEECDLWFGPDLCSYRVVPMEDSL